MTTRKINIFGAIVLMTAAGGFGWLAVASRQSPVASPEITPSLVVEPSVADLGLARQNQTLVGSCTVTNRYPVAIDITEVMKSCSCADAELEPRQLEPGQTATLRIAWKTGTKRGLSSDRINLVAKTREPNPQTVFSELRLRCDVQPDVLVEPAELQFVEGTAGSISLVVKSGVSVDVKVKQAFSNTKSIRVTVRATNDSVAIEYDPSVPQDDLNPPTVMIETTSVSEQWVRVPVKITPSAKESK